MPSPAALFEAIVFGAIGMAFFVYGKRQALWKPMALGVALMVFPYFVADAFPMFLVGAGLCAGGFFLWE